MCKDSNVHVEPKVMLCSYVVTGVSTGPCHAQLGLQHSCDKM